MSKSIKKILKRIYIASGAVAGLVIILYFGMQLYAVQTFIIKKVTDRISKEFNSTVQIGKVEFEFFDRLSLGNVLIKDRHNDTLIFCEKVITGISRLRLKESSFRFGNVYLSRPVFAMATDSLGELNLKWYLDQLKNNDSTKVKKPVGITFDHIDLHEARFSLYDSRKSDGINGINFSNLKAGNINGTVEQLKIDGDTISLGIHNLALKEASGFTVKKLNSNMSITKGRLAFSNVGIICDSTVIDMPTLELLGDSSGSFSNFVENVRLRINLNNSLISTSDLMYFVPALRPVNEAIQLSGRISGTISELRGRNIIASYREHTYLDCDFDISGLPDIKDAFIYIGISKLTTDAGDIEKLSIDNKQIALPDMLYKTGKLSFDGSFTGFITDFVAYGKLNSPTGAVAADLSLRPVDRRNYIIKGMFKGSGIDLGEITGNSQNLGKMSISSDIDGSVSATKRFAVNLTGTVDSIDIKNYRYRNIALNGLFTDKMWDGSIDIDDENLKMDIQGLFSFEKELPEFNFTLNLAKANLFNLNIEKKDTTSAASLLITSDFRGNSIDNLNGEIKLLNANFIRHRDTLELNDLAVNTFIEDSKPVLSLRSDFVDADMKGMYSFGNLQNLFRYAVSNIMPLKHHSGLRRADLGQNDFLFSVNLKNTGEINSFFNTGLQLSSNSHIEGIVNSDSIIMLSGRIKELTVYNNRFNDFNLNAVFKDSIFNADITNSSLDILEQSTLDSFSINISAAHNSFTFKTLWGGGNRQSNSGTIIAKGAYFTESSDAGKVLLGIDIEPTEVRTRTNLWEISGSNIVIDTSAIKISGFQAGSSDYFYSVDGSVSLNPADTLRLGFRGIGIAPLNYFINRNKNDNNDGLALDIDGTLNGNIILANLYRSALIQGNLTIDNLTALGSNFGALNIASAIDVNTNVIALRAKNSLNGENNIDVEGYYDPPAKKLDLAITANKLPVAPLNLLLNSFASGISGRTSGKINLQVNPGNISLDGSVMAENTTIKIDYLQALYRINDSIRFDEKGIHFNNIRLLDERGNHGFLSGVVSHKNFKNITPNLTVNIFDAMVLNTKPKDNSQFYGSAFASGIATIKTLSGGAMTFDISASTGHNTRFYIPLSTGASVSDAAFVTFVDHARHDTIPSPLLSLQPQSSGMDLNMDLRVNPEAEIQLIFDLTVGDIMKANGSGNLNINYNRRGELNIIGDYVIDRGDYLFTLGNFLNKHFSVQNGSRIIFSGDINNAEIDIMAIYRLRASLAEIVPSAMAADGATGERVQVECRLNLTGKLFNPRIAFDIYLPTVDERTRAYLKNVTATEEQLSRQFLYLLVMNRFYPDPISGVSPTTAGATGGAAAVTTSEMLFSQLSNMLSKISDDVNIGINYRPGDGNSTINPDLWEVATIIPVLNDRVTLNGNFDIRGTSSPPATAGTSPNNITGDFDAELKVTDKIRFKVFNRYNNPYEGKSDAYTQGIGIFFRQEFNRFSDLFRKDTLKTH
ncbi:MAG: translocation/assembly module TamB [Bacteroidales bacterium]|jgi:cytoskeletal protein CcmA (bactofilin family)|nr:translocation/assembly module TamB [Bacteroidales bacterium]